MTCMCFCFAILQHIMKMMSVLVLCWFTLPYDFMTIWVQDSNQSTTFPVSIPDSCTFKLILFLLWQTQHILWVRLCVRPRLTKCTIKTGSRPSESWRALTSDPPVSAQLRQEDSGTTPGHVLRWNQTVACCFHLMSSDKHFTLKMSDNIKLTVRSTHWTLPASQNTLSFNGTTFFPSITLPSSGPALPTWHTLLWHQATLTAVHRRILKNHYIL